MKTHELFREISAQLGIDDIQDIYRKSQSLVYKWGQPTGSSGARNPLDRLLDIIQKLEKAGRNDLVDELARVLFSRSGLRFERIEQTPADACDCDVPKMLMKHILTLSTCLDSENITAEERKNALEAIRQLKELIRIAEQTVSFF